MLTILIFRPLFSPFIIVKSFNISRFDPIYFGKVNTGTVAKHQVEQVGLDWSNVSKKLTENGWAEQVSPTELCLKADLDVTKDRMSKEFGNDFSKILPILQQSHTVNSFHISR